MMSINKEIREMWNSLEGKHKIDTPFRVFRAGYLCGMLRDKFQKEEK